jgi:hypothetical protein
VITPPPSEAIDAQLDACPDIAQLTVPVGAGTPETPVTVTVKVSDWPTVGVAGEAVTEIVGINTWRLIAIVDEVVEL